MEFKGTKGQWKTLFHNSQTFVTSEAHGAICIIPHDGKNTDEHNSNAKLISCAPEMLEMISVLKDIILMHLPIQSNKNYSYEFEKFHEAVELIQKATTI